MESKGRKVRGRSYPWGVVEGILAEAGLLAVFSRLVHEFMHVAVIVVVVVVSVEDPVHSDFLLLRNMLVRTHMQDLKEVTQETHYENYRAECIHKMTQMVVQDKKRR